MEYNYYTIEKACSSYQKFLKLNIDEHLQLQTASWSEGPDEIYLYFGSKHIQLTPESVLPQPVIDVLMTWAEVEYIEDPQEYLIAFAKLHYKERK